MEVSMFSGYPDMGMMNNDLNYFHNQLQVNSLEELLESSLLPPYGNSFEQLESNQGLVSSKRSLQNDVQHTTFIENPFKKLKTNNNWESYDHQMSHVLNSSQDQHDSNSTIISFSNSSNSSSQTSTLITPKEEAISNNNSNSFGYPPFHHEMVVNQEKQSSIFESRPHQQVVDKKNIKVGSNMPSQAMDHIMAERKRREKLSQRFIALSAVIPGLKKLNQIVTLVELAWSSNMVSRMDKASVLGDAIKYVKQMQEKVKKLEEEAKKRSIESAVFVKRSYVFSAEDNEDLQFSAKSTTTDNNAAAAATSCCNKASFPEIEARISDKDVLITAHCEPKKGMFEKLISQIEKLHLTVVCSSSLAFGNSALAITITAQMDAEYSMTAKDLVRHLHSTLK